MTNPIVQSVVADGLTTGNEIQLAYAGAQTAGNCNVLLIGWDDDTTTISALPVDSKGNIYRLITSVAANNVSQSVYVCDGAVGIKAAGAGANTVTVVWSSGSVSFPELYLLELQGPLVVDALAVAIASSLTAPTEVTSAGPVTSHYPNEAFIAYCFTDGSANAADPGPGWTYDVNTVTGFGEACQWQVVTTAGGSVTAVTNLASSDRWCQSVVGLAAPVTASFTTDPPRDQGVFAVG